MIPRGDTTLHGVESPTPGTLVLAGVRETSKQVYYLSSTVIHLLLILESTYNTFDMDQFQHTWSKEINFAMKLIVTAAAHQKYVLDETYVQKPRSRFVYAISRSLFGTLSPGFPTHYRGP